MIQPRIKLYSISILIVGEYGGPPIWVEREEEEQSEQKLGKS
jgi:hypothetical protein